METKKIEQVGNDFDAMIGAITAEALTISQASLAKAEEDEALWKALYAKIPEGRLRALPEVAAIYTSQNAARDHAQRVRDEIDRFARPAGAFKPLMP